MFVSRTFAILSMADEAWTATITIAGYSAAPGPDLNGRLLTGSRGTPSNGVGATPMAIWLSLDVCLPPLAALHPKVPYQGTPDS
jgi:hypothetical protein